MCGGQKYELFFFLDTSVIQLLRGIFWKKLNELQKIFP